MNYLLLLFIALNATAQEPTKILLKPKFRFFAEDTSKFKKHIDFQIDGRNSFVKNKPVNISGLNLGYILSERVRIGIGIYKINQKYYSKRTPDALLLTSNQLKLHYITPNLNYTFFYNRWVEISLLPETGFGIVNFQSTNPISHKITTIKEWFVPLQIGCGGLLKINPWLGVQGSIGYRYIIIQSNEAVFKTIFNGMYFNYGVQLVLGRIFKDIYYCHKYHKQQKALKK